jgi:hypothetical protein
MGDFRIGKDKNDAASPPPPSAFGTFPRKAEEGKA